MMKRLSVFLSSIAAMCVWAGNAQAVVLETNEWSNTTQAGWLYSPSPPVIGAVSARSTQNSHSAPFSSQPARYSS